MKVCPAGCATGGTEFITADSADGAHLLLDNVMPGLKKSRPVLLLCASF